MSANPPPFNNLIKATGNTLRALFVAEQDPVHIHWILGIITLCALILRMLVINRPIGYDEAYTFIHFASRSYTNILADYHAPNNHILNTILIAVAYRLLGEHIWIVRVPAFLASVLSIPAAYFTARRFYSRNQALAVSAVLAIYTSIISASANGRGYTLVILLSLALANLAAYLITNQSRTALIAYAVTGALGFYTIPIFLYPMAGISLWVVTTYLTDREPWHGKTHKLGSFLGACIFSGGLTLLLYSPVIIFGTGLNSIINNEIVATRDWSNLIDSLPPRITKTWADWTFGLSPAVQYLLSAGFLISIFFHRKISQQKLPLQLFLFLAVAIILVIQKVIPLPRIWSYLEYFCVLFSIAGLLWVVDLSVKKIAGQDITDKLLPIVILLFTLSVSINSIIKTQSPSAIADRPQLLEQYAADYLTSHLQPGDTILAVAPIDMRAAYHLKINGVPYDVFYQRDHPVEFQTAFVILRGREQLNTPEKVIGFFQLRPKLNPASAVLVYEYGELQIYAVPAQP